MDETALQQSLLNAKRFMEHEKMQTESSVSEKALRQPTQVMESSVSQPINPMPHNTPIPSQTPAPSPVDLNPHSKITKKSIMDSRLPNAIKKAMIENPIPDLNAGASLNPSFINEVAQKMNSANYSVDGMRQNSNSNIKSTLKENAPQTPPIPPPVVPIVLSSLKAEIKSLITESLDELIEAKVNKLLLKSTNIKENIQLRVGSKIFTGKLSKVKTLKS